MKFRILLPLFLFSGSIFLYGQSAWTNYSEQNSPLPQNTVRCIVIDTNDHKWIGTDYGLAKFTETSWTVYTTTNSQLPDNNIRSLAIDGQGALWIGTLSGGVVKYSNNTWTTYNSTNSGLPGNFIRSIAFDHDGNTWMAGSAGLCMYDGTTWTSWDNTNSPLISHHIASMAIGDDGTKYLGTINGGLVYFKDTSYSFYNLWNEQLPDNSVLSVTTDTSGNRWIAMPSGGVAVHYGASVWQGFNTVNSNIPSDAINAVYIDRMNHAYIGSQDKGLIMKKGFDFIHYDSLNSGLPDVNVLCMAKDQSGKLWLGTMYNGLVKLDETLLTIKQNAESDDIQLITTLVHEGEMMMIISVRRAEVLVYAMDGREVKRFFLAEGVNEITADFGSKGLYLVGERKGIKMNKLVVY